MAATFHQAHAAVVWLDHWHALVARHDRGAIAIVDLDRGAEPEPAFLDRVSELTAGCDRLMILGPGEAQLELGRAYVGHHGGHVVALDMEACAAATPTQLCDRLRLLEGDELARPVG